MTTRRAILQAIPMAALLAGPRQALAVESEISLEKQIVALAGKLAQREGGEWVVDCALDVGMIVIRKSA